MTYPYLEPRAEYDVARYEAMLDAAQAQAQAEYEAALCDGETLTEKLAWECGKTAFAGGITRWHAAQRLAAQPGSAQNMPGADLLAVALDSTLSRAARIAAMDELAQRVLGDLP